jgi:hypothetical protein
VQLKYLRDRISWVSFPRNKQNEARHGRSKGANPGDIAKGGGISKPLRRRRTHLDKKELSLRRMFTGPRGQYAHVGLVRWHELKIELGLSLAKKNPGFFHCFKKQRKPWKL